ncbi:MAG: type II toxin-antitoxin system RelE/ParE family toxin [Ideonella sp.]|nr:type II toxin-antitoxin system RelE/ParE family toxin [Ideonella sp.]MCC7458557.1 type II toxin-antitoxin system RelE/ParE family toxin [Nitrospira sp.]
MTLKKVPARFYLTSTGSNPVRDWLIALPAGDRRQIGHDIGAVEYGWPVGMPLCRGLGEGLWEVRSSLPSRRIARVLFCLVEGELILLHAFVKKTQKTPTEDLALARKRQKEIER